MLQKIMNLGLGLGLALCACTLFNGNGTDDDPPAAPGNMTLTAQENRILVDWDLVAEAEFYRLYWTDDGSAPDKNSARLDSLTVPPYVHDSLEYHHTYTYRMSAVNENGEGDLSAAASATPIAPPVPVPAGLTAAPGTGPTSIELDWNDLSLSGATFTVYRRKSTDPVSAQIAAGLTASAYTDQNITAGTGYLYKVKTVLAGDVPPRESPFGPEVHGYTWATINETEPNGPTGTLDTSALYPYAEDVGLGLDGMILKGTYDTAYDAYSAKYSKNFDFDLFKFTLNKGDSVIFQAIKGNMAPQTGMSATIFEVYKDGNGNLREINIEPITTANESFTYTPYAPTSYQYAYIQVELPQDLVSSGPFDYEIRLKIVRK